MAASGQRHRQKQESSAHPFGLPGGILQAFFESYCFHRAPQGLPAANQRYTSV